MTLTPRAQVIVDDVTSLQAERDHLAELLGQIAAGHQMTTVDGLALIHVPATVVTEIRRVLGT